MFYDLILLCWKTVKSPLSIYTKLCKYVEHLTIPLTINTVIIHRSCLQWPRSDGEVSEYVLGWWRLHTHTPFMKYMNLHILSWLLLCDDPLFNGVLFHDLSETMDLGSISWLDVEELLNWLVLLCCNYNRQKVQKIWVKAELCIMYDITTQKYSRFCYIYSLVQFNENKTFRMQYKIDYSFHVETLKMHLFS